LCAAFDSLSKSLIWLFDCKRDSQINQGSAQQLCVQLFMLYFLAEFCKRNKSQTHLKVSFKSCFLKRLSKANTVHDNNFSCDIGFINHSVKQSSSH